MNNLATKNQDDYTITSTGEAYTTQRKAAEMMGVSRNAVNAYFGTRNLDVSQGVSSENLALLGQHYATKGRPEAVAMLVKFARAGAQAYIYTEAGYHITVAKPSDLKPEYLTRSDLVEVIALVVGEVVKQVQGFAGTQAVAVPNESIVERQSRPFAPLQPGFIPWREAAQKYFPGHAEAVFHQVMAAAKVAKQPFDVQFSESEVNPSCASYQENLIAGACAEFIRHSVRKVRKDGTQSPDQWTNRLLQQSFYRYAGEYVIRHISFL